MQFAACSCTHSDPRTVTSECACFAEFRAVSAKKTLYVVCCISNPRGYKRRYQLYREFAARMAKEKHVVMYTIEAAFGQRRHKVTVADNPRHVQVRTTAEVWHKENMLNLCVARLPNDWRYMAWIDADVTFGNTKWASDAIKALHHHPVVQLFQDSVDLGPKGEVIAVQHGFCFMYLSGQRRGPAYALWHPGYAWACTREAYDTMGGLLDFAVLGAGDHHMALAFLNRVDESTPRTGMHPNYLAQLLVWQRRAWRAVRGNLGFVHGTLLHHFHGRKADRKYIERWEVLKKHSYDPLCDLRRDWQGLWSIDEKRVGLIQALQGYFAQRNEDGVETEPVVIGKRTF